MPELPEIETVCRGIEKRVLNASFTHVQMNRPDLRFPMPSDMPAQLKNHQIKNVRRRNKYILIDTDKNLTLIMHLGMSGRIVFYDSHDFEQQKHDHVIFYTNDNVTMVFNDPRRFGVIDLVATGQWEEHRLMKNIGLDPFDDRFTADWLMKKWQGKKTSVKTALLDQRIIAGLGNIYVCEALFRSQIHPASIAGNVKKKSFPILVDHIRQVLSQAIAAGGSSLKDYVQTDGTLGYFQNSFEVYGREKEPCVSCQTPIERIVQSGRSSFYCKQCQKKV